MIGISATSSPYNARLDDHLGRELHARAAQVEALVQLLGEAAHAAVDVMDRGPEHLPGQQGEHPVAQHAVRPGHGPGQDRAAAGRKPATLDQAVSLTQLLDKARDLTEVIAVVRVAHDDEPALGSGNTAHEGVPVPFGRDANHAGAEAQSGRVGAVRAAVVGHDDLSRQAVLFQRPLSFLHARGDRIDLVQTGHNHADFGVIGRVSLKRPVRSVTRGYGHAKALMGSARSDP